MPDRRLALRRETLAPLTAADLAGAVAAAASHDTGCSFADLVCVRTLEAYCSWSCTAEAH